MPRPRRRVALISPACRAGRRAQHRAQLAARRPRSAKSAPL